MTDQTIADLVREGEVRLRTDDDGIASWERHDGLSFGYGPGSLWHVRVRVTTHDAIRADVLSRTSSWVTLVEGDSPSDALDAALYNQTLAVADIVDGPVELPDVDDALWAAVLGFTGTDGIRA